MTFAALKNAAISLPHELRRLFCLLGKAVNGTKIMTFGNNYKTFSKPSDTPEDQKVFEEALGVERSCPHDTRCNTVAVFFHLIGHHNLKYYEDTQ